MAVAECWRESNHALFSTPVFCRGVKNMKFKNLVSTVVFITCVFMVPAAAQKITYAVEPGTNFSRFKTFKWERAEKASYPSRDLDEMFIRTIEAEMAKKGLTPTNSDTPDLFVTYQIAVLDDIEWSSHQSMIPWGSVAGVTYGIGGAQINAHNVIQKGSFILDFYDAGSKRQLWQARAVKTLAETTDIKKREKNLKKIMTKIFQNYPPSAN